MDGAEPGMTGRGDGRVLGRHADPPTSHPTPAGGTRVLFHVDMDAFFAAVETRERPGLARVPLVIGADPQNGRGRGVVCTANYVARRYGIHSAMPIGKAWEACPHAVFLGPDGGKYRPASHEVMAVLARYADVLQVVGLDEAYLDVTGRCGGDWGRARALAHSLQAAVKRETGLGCSVGVAHTKSLAKIASDHRKPHGVTVVPPAEAPRFLDPLPVRLINGCGPKTARSLEEWDLPTIGELARADPAFLESRFGKHGLWLWRVANGDDPRPVEADRGPAKSRGNERTYARDERDMGRVRASARRLLSGLLAGRAARDRRAFSTVTVKVRYSDFTTVTRAHTLSVALEPEGAETEALSWATCESLLSGLLDGRPVRLVGVRLSGFSETTGQARLGSFGLQVAPAAARTPPPVPPS